MNLYALSLPESEILSNAAAVVKQPEHDTVATQGKKHVDAALRIIVSPAVEAAQVGDDKRQVG